MAKSSKVNQKEISEGKIFAVLAYLSILCIIPLIFKRDNPFALYHGKQGLVIFLGHVAAFVLHTIPFLSWLLNFSTFVLGVVSFISIIAVLNGQNIKLPIISDIAEAITL